MNSDVFGAGLILAIVAGISGSLLGACSSDSTDTSKGTPGSGATASGGTATSGGATTASGGTATSGGVTANGGATASGGTTTSGGYSASGGRTASGGAVGAECRTTADCPQTNCFGCPGPVCVNGHCVTASASGGAGGVTGTGGAGQTGGVSNAGGAGGGACAGATVGASCAPEGTTCGGPCPDQCTFCNLLRCNGGKWMGVEAPPPPCFDCGTNLKCMQNATYCDVIHSGVGQPDVHTCKAMPAACKTTVTCVCMKTAVMTDRCTESTRGGLVVEHDGG